jgi:hypothetical protein
MMLSDLTIKIPSGLPSVIGWIVIVILGALAGLCIVEFILGLFYRGN